jgi:hypothetical protein
MASWILIRAGEIKSGQDCLNEMLKTPSPVRLFALNVLDWMRLDSIEPYKANLLALATPQKSRKSGPKQGQDYEGDLGRYILESHGVKTPPLLNSSLQAPE